MDRPCFNEIAWRNEAILLESRELENNLCHNNIWMEIILGKQ